MKESEIFVKMRTKLQKTADFCKKPAVKHIPHSLIPYYYENTMRFANLRNLRNLRDKGFHADNADKKPNLRNLRNQRDIKIEISET